MNTIIQPETIATVERERERERERALFIQHGIRLLDYIWINLINRANKGNEGCIICNPYKINNAPVMGRFTTRKNNLVTNRIRDGDFL